MPEPTTAWLWRPGDARGRRGTLSIEARVLTFRTDGGEVIRLRGIERVRRQRGTPVLEVRYRADDGPRLGLIFFASPPDLPDRPSAPTPLAVLGARGLRRVSEMGRLRSEHRRLKPLVERWARTVREEAD